LLLNANQGANDAIHTSSQSQVVGRSERLTGGLTGALEWYSRVDSMGRVTGGFVAVRLYVKHLRFSSQLLKVRGEVPRASQRLMRYC